MGDKIMSCFEDYMRFRDEVEEAKGRIRGNGAAAKASSSSKVSEHNDVCCPTE